MSNWGTTPELPDLLPGGSRRITYQQAISEAFEAALQDPRVRIFGEGVTDKYGFYGTLNGLRQSRAEQLGLRRVFDVPVAEGLITGVGVGMALGGLRPIVIHPRNDFLLLGLDQLCNHAAKWKMMTGHDCPLIVVTVTCRGWGTAAQHSQALHATFAHFPGLDVALPFQPATVLAAFEAALLRTQPTVIALDKWLWKLTGPADYSDYGNLPDGRDLTILGIGHSNVIACEAAIILRREHNIGAKVEPVLWLNENTGDSAALACRLSKRLLVVDTGHISYGASAEIIASVVERVPGAKCARVARPDSPVPACDEQNYFPGVDDVVRKAVELCKQS